MATTVPSTTSQFGKEIDPAVRKFFVENYKKFDPMVEKVFRVTDQRDYNEEEQTVFGIGELAQIPEAQNYPVTAPQQGYTTTYTAEKYGNLIELSDQLVRYDKSTLAKAETLARMRSQSAANKVGKLGASVFNNGFDTAFTSYGDNKPLFSTQHTNSTGGSAQSNASATGIPLTEANLETGLIALRQQLSDNGEPVMFMPDCLLVPLALEKEALILTKSSGRPSTADNDTNVYALREYGDSMLTVKAWRYLDSDLGGSNTAWFLADSSQHLVTWKWGIKPEVGERNDYEGYRNDTLIWKVRFEASYGWSDFRGTWGSKGDGVAYSD